MIDHSQYGEQRYIIEYFRGKTGTFLDIGANDGHTFSNTHALALSGWNGVCVEPTPQAFENLGLTYAGRPDIQLIEAAITSADGRVKMQVASDTLVSSLDVRAPDTWEGYGFTWSEIEVEAMGFTTLLSKSEYKTFDFINIDVEGHNMSTLRQMDLSALGCQCLCIEHDGKINEVKDYCVGMKELHRNGVNLIMVR